MLGGPMSFMLLIRPEFPLDENQGHKALWRPRYKSNLRKIRRHHTTLGQRLIIREARSRTHRKGIGNRSCGPKFWKNDFRLRKTGGNAIWGLGKRKPQEDRGVNSGGRKRKKKKRQNSTAEVLLSSWLITGSAEAFFRILEELPSFHIPTPRFFPNYSRVRIFSAVAQSRLDSKGLRQRERDCGAVNAVISGAAVSFWHLSCRMTLVKCELWRAVDRHLE